MSKKTDKAYEKILRAFESPDEQFDSFGDIDKEDLDRNFEKPNPEAEGKGWSDWDKEKEADTAHEDLLPIEEESATNPSDNYSTEPENIASEDVDLPIAEDDDHDEDEWGKQSFDEQKEDEDGLRAQRFDDSRSEVGQWGESFKEEDLKDINEIFSESKDYDGYLDINSDRGGLVAGNRADDISGTTDDDENQEVKVGQNQEPNKELGSRKVQLAKETGYIIQRDGLNIGEGYEDDMLDQKNEDKKMDQDWDNFVERDVGGEDPEDDADEGLDMGSLQPVKEDTTSPTSPQIKQDLAEVEQQGPEEPFLSGGAKATNTTAKDYYNYGQDILEEENEITNRTSDLEDLATGETKTQKKTKI